MQILHNADKDSRSGDVFGEERRQKFCTAEDEAGQRQSCVSEVMLQDNKSARRGRVSCVSMNTFEVSLSHLDGVAFRYSHLRR